MNLMLDYTNLLKSKNLPKGISLCELENGKALVKQAFDLFKLKKNNEPLGFYDLPDYDTKIIKNFINKNSQREKPFNTIVVLGIGGSALGNKAVYNALRHQKNLNKLYVYDNVDPYLWQDILDNINIETTLFNVITKSGTTAETMSSFMFIMNFIKEKFPQDYKERIVITTDKEKGFLRQIVLKEGFESFIVPDDVGGRFSVLTDVGLLSSAFVGIDIDALLKGAKKMRKLCDENDIFKNPAMIIALTHLRYMNQGKNISVMMPYSNALYDLADWYRQLWAESLGKKVDLEGKEVFTGQTPIKALGATDQHSQVQLYVEGPKDKVFTFLMVENYKIDFTIPNIYPERAEVNYLSNSTFSKLLNSECIATELALTEANCPNMTIKFKTLNEESIGAFIYLYEAATIFTGYMLNINPLNQPGVEAGKIATYALMNKKGFEETSQKINNYIKNKEKQGNILCLN